ncbi:hypothetical protein [Candidatus Aquiluna sp. UB-MaderosW2red]|uniref:hypothetical protein n=1 Tax=Candidatus Aquiluna sp. UB-MaderosW2red TaxID=1855377 RepID=UPI000875C78F|nr:hypothetical protein [Candidatus Aquiluna sp. UB-MaderosW2red]SCX13055.1 hypothetical protein SAMN05216534_1353 [Candidatus Aquiluna sp. UB-MaderosW2red]
MTTDHAAKEVTPDRAVTPAGPPGQPAIAQTVMLIHARQGQGPSQIVAIGQQEVMRIDHAAREVTPDREVTPAGPPGQPAIAMSDLVAVLRIAQTVILILGHQGQGPSQIVEIGQQEVMRIDHAVREVIPDREVTPAGPPGQPAIAMSDLVAVLRIAQTVILILGHQGQGPSQIVAIGQQEVMRIDHAVRGVIPDREVTPAGPPGQPAIAQTVILILARQGQGPSQIVAIGQQEVMRIDHAAKEVIPDRAVTPAGPPGQPAIAQIVILILARQGQGPSQIVAIGQQEVMRIGHAAKEVIPDRAVTPAGPPGQPAIAQIVILIHALQGQGPSQIVAIGQQEVMRIGHAAKEVTPDRAVTPAGPPGQPAIVQRMTVRGAMVTLGPPDLQIKNLPGPAIRGR